MGEVLPPTHVDIDAILRALSRGGVEFVLIGGVAVGMHGAVRATKDVDIVPSPERENLERLASVVRGLEGRQIGVDTEFLPHQPTGADGLDAGGSFQLATVHGQLDILQEGGAIPAYEELSAAAPETEYEGLALRYCSREHLIAMKRRAGRPLDLRDLEELGADDPQLGGCR
ncbi:nucleotidyl transferase AbiEii/AbiGii toxin family protein [soil metagenome]